MDSIMYIHSIFSSIINFCWGDGGWDTQCRFAGEVGDNFLSYFNYLIRKVVD